MSVPSPPVAERAPPPEEGQADPSTRGRNQIPAGILNATPQVTLTYAEQRRCFERIQDLVLELTWFAIGLFPTIAQVFDVPAQPGAPSFEPGNRLGERSVSH